MLYLTALLSCLVFYWAYQEWLGWVILQGVLWLPVLSLGVSSCPGPFPQGRRLCLWVLTEK